MPDQCSVQNAQRISLEAEALRYLVTRPQLAKAIWHSDAAEPLWSALEDIHGPDVVEIEELVSREILATVLKTVVVTLRNAVGKLLSYTEAHHMKDIIRLAVSLQLGRKHFSEDVQQTLLCSWIYASVPILLEANGDELNSVYREHVDTARKGFLPSTRRLQNISQRCVSSIKSIARTLHAHSKNDRKRVKREVMSVAEGFFKDYPKERLIEVAISETRKISDSLPTPQVFKENEDGKGNSSRKRSSKQLRNRDSVPDFFSDADGSDINDGEGSEQDKELAMEQESPAAAANQYMSRVEIEQVDREEEAAAVDRGRKHSRKRSRRSSEQNVEAPIEENPVEPEQNIADNRTIPWRLRTRKQNQSTRQLDAEVLTDLDQEEREEVNSFKSQDFSSSSSERSRGGSRAEPNGTDFEHVARHAGASKAVGTPDLRRSQRKRAVIVKAEKLCDDDHSSDSDAYDSDEENDSGKAERDRAALSGRAGAAVRGLHNSTTKLRNSRIPDPLSEAQRDARNIRRRTRTNALQTYSPASNARAASPIPDSEDVISRKKPKRFHLDNSPDTEQGLNAPIYRGKYVRSGRFRPSEDELLIAGLRKYGWGAWAYIAQDFGDAEYTRAPGSLKDRARTLELDQKDYPFYPGAKRGRPPKMMLDRTSSKRNTSNNNPEPIEDNTDMDEDED